MQVQEQPNPWYMDPSATAFYLAIYELVIKEEGLRQRCKYDRDSWNLVESVDRYLATGRPNESCCTSTI